MKRLLLFWALLLCSITATFAQFSGSGSGTKDDPYKIFYAEQLTQVRNFLNQSGVYFKLMSDINLEDWISENSPTEGWQPIGVESSKFKGIFDGNGHTISNVYINRPSTQYVGFFGCVEGASISNLTIEGEIKAHIDVGSIAGNAHSSTFTQCIFRGKIDADESLGGITGFSGDNSSFTSCAVENIQLTGGKNVGGISGNSSSATFSKCEVTAIISGTECLGGVVGNEVNNVNVSNSIVKANIAGTNYIGGLIGNLNSGKPTIKKNSYYGKIEGESYIGGLLGKANDINNGSIQDNYSICDLNSKGDNIGGLIGYMYSSSGATIIEDCYHSGNVIGNNNIGGLIGYGWAYYDHITLSRDFSIGSVYGASIVGGIAGFAHSNVQLYKCVAANEIVSATVSSVGRIAGSGPFTFGTLGTADGNLALSTTKISKAGIVQTITESDQNGMNISQTGLKLKANYVAHGWDFNNNWTIQETETYPYKPWQAAAPTIESDLVSKATVISGKSIDGGTVYIQIGDDYKDSTVCSNNQWTFSVPTLQSGDQVRLYAVSDSKWKSQYTDNYVSYPGKGTEAEPYLVYTASDLQGAYRAGYYKLMNDLDLTDWINQNSPKEGWPAIGKNGVTNIYFDGGNHTISGLWCSTTADYNGLFSNFPGGYIRNLTVKTADGKKVSGGDYTGALIGRFSDGTIDNVTVEGSIASTSRGGGIVGVTSNVTVNNVKFNGNVESSSKNAVLGGIIGEATGGKVTKANANAQVKATGESTIAGGLIGDNVSSTSLSYSTGSVSLSGSNSYSGGLIGLNEATGSISNCYSTSNTTSTNYAAGLVAYNFGTVSSSYAKGEVSSTYYGAGCVGYNDGTKATINNCVASNPKINVTDQSGWSIRVLGGYKNNAPDPGENNYALNTMILSVNGVPKKATDNLLDGYDKTEAELMSSATYIGLGWDFSKTWGIDEGSIYPYLLWEVDVNPVADITFDKSSIILPVGKSDTISVSVLPLGATNKRLAWTSNNTTVATVADGIVTAVAKGEAVITATSTDGSNISATCKVTVTKNKDAAVAQLQALVDKAQALYDNSTEGSEIGQYATGSRAELLKVITAVKAKISDTMSDADLAQCSTDIQNAIDTFNSKKVTAGADTDISKLDNTVYIENLEGQAGSTVTLSVKMKNTFAVQGLQFDLYLPDGITFAKDENGDVDATLSTDRTTSKKTDLFSFAFQKDGALRLIATSTKGYTFSGNDGEIVKIKVNIDNDAANGDYPLIFKNVVISSHDVSVYAKQSYVKSTLTVSSYTLGDVDDNGEINVMDIIATSNYILGENPSPFIFTSADINADNEINIVDMIGISNLILGGATVSKVAPLNRQAMVGAFSAAPFEISAGNTLAVAFDMTNNLPVIGYQFDLTLPEGVTLKSIAMGESRANAQSANILDFARLENGNYRVLCASTNGQPILGNEGAVVNLELAADKDVSEGAYNMTVSNVIMAGRDSAANQESFMVPFQVGTSTFISSIGVDANTLVNVYSINGTLVRMKVKAVDCLKNLPKGIYLVNGKKIVK